MASTASTSVVLYSFSTSNHNPACRDVLDTALFFIPFLHQTTTHNCCVLFRERCSLFLFYIKPQLNISSLKAINSCSLFLFYIKPQHNEMKPFLPAVVLYSFSTSNHNKISRRFLLLKLFFIPFLHQTTTRKLCAHVEARCSLFLFYIKPQLRYLMVYAHRVVLYSFSTSNHNPL